MPSQILSALLDEKIRIFTAAFRETAHEVFFDPTKNALRHAGEYGAFRELVVRDFLKFFTPGRLDIHNGFVITGRGSVSTQCDVIVYDAKNTPLIESGERQRFFPVESACAVGEVKSVMSKAQLKAALNKLSAIKALREQVDAPTVIRRERDGPFDPQNYAYDQLPTFLICQKFDFDFSGLPSEVDSMYEASVAKRHRHNLILSLEDGLLAYCDSNGMTMMFPELGERITPTGLSQKVGLRNRLVVPANGAHTHIQMFCSYMFLMSSSTTILYPDMSSYIALGRSAVSDQP